MIKMTFQKSRRCLNILFITSISIFLFAFMHFATLPIKNAKAEDAEGEQTIIAQITQPASIVTISVPDAVLLELSPDVNGLMTVVSSDIRVGTSSSSGYKLYLEMTGNNSTTNSLLNTTDSNKQITSTGTFTDPVALTNGKWGYAFSSSEDVLFIPNGFDANYDTMQSGTPTNNKFAAVPESNQPAQKIAETDELGDDILTVYYGLRAGYETATGTYANKVLYTAIADDAANPDLEFAPAAIFERGGENLQITTPLYSTTSEVETHVYLLTAAEYEDVTENGTPVSNYSNKELECSRTEEVALQLNCTTIETSLGENHIYIDVPHYGQVYSEIIPIKDTAPDNMWTLKTLQGFDDWPEFCDDLVTPSASATRDVTSWAEYSAVADKTTVVPTHTMIDVRDGKAYQVKKLADGRCWMTENLRLEDYTMTNADSNLPSGKTVTIPSSRDSINRWCNGNSAGCYERLITMNYTDAGNSSHPEYGSYYNWYTATATYGKRSTTSDTNYSICPAGWRLPKGGPNGEFQALYDAGYNTPALMMKDAGGPHFVLSGAREGGSTEATGEIGRYWSSTALSNDTKRAYRFYVSNKKVETAAPNLYGKHRGLSVRCINAN